MSMCKKLFLGFLGLCGLTLLLTLSPANKCSAADNKVVSFEVTGNQTISTGRIILLVQTKTGQTYSEDVLSEDIKRLLATGLFSEVVPKVEEISGGVKITIQVKENPTIKGIKFTGNKRYNRKLLQDESGLTVGQLYDKVKALEAKGYLENAVVMFTSDHGDCLGDHGHSQKWTMYDTITRVPTVVWGPGRFDGGRRIEDLVQSMDLGPTILELAGVRVPETFEAESVLAALKGEETGGRETVFAEHPRDGTLQETEFMTMVRTREWKLVHFLDEPFGQLFDLVSDPEEVHNLWDSASAQGKKQELLDLMRDWLIRSNCRTREWASAWR